MRFSTKQHKASWGIDLHARSLDVGGLPRTATSSCTAPCQLVRTRVFGPCPVP